MATWIDRFLWLVKWPLAMTALVLLPGSAQALVHTVRAVLERHQALLPFIAGFLAYAAAWWLLFRRPAWGSLMSTLEHELTHALFALLTLHAVKGLTTSWKDGGHTTFSGGTGNWLISLAPYFFPTVSILVAIGLAYVPAEHLRWAMALLGATIAYHIASTWKETHLRQTDLAEAGFVFSIAVLPTANLLVYGGLLAFVLGGARGIWAHMGDAERCTLALIREVGRLR